VTDATTSAELLPAAATGGQLDGFLDQLEAPAPSPCGGTAAAATAAMAAALVTMVARGSVGWADGAGVASQARALRSRLTALGDDDAAAFEHVLVTMRDSSGSPEQRDFALGTALLHAAEVPLRIAETAADVAELAAAAAAAGSPQLRPDATAAAALAEAATRAAAHLVEINLAIVPGDRLSERAALLVTAAAEARKRALGAA
jgi:glutamate formiminotransferase/formiminotetrahydrofolate cyclodeaminase